MLSFLVTVSTHTQNLYSPDVLNALLAEISENDKTSLSKLYRRTRAAVYGFALSYLKNGQDADDITQGTCVCIWENAHRYQKRNTPLAWILTIFDETARTFQGPPTIRTRKNEIFLLILMLFR